MTADDKQRILEQAKAGGFDDRHLASLEAIIDGVSWTSEDDTTVLATKLGDIITDRLKAEGIDYFPELPQILMNASVNAAMSVEHLRNVRGGIEVFRSINTHAVESVMPEVNSAEANLVRIRDSLRQTSQILTGEELDTNKEGLHG